MEKQSRQPLIVAMKGHPGTGKSTLARAISSSLHFPLLDKDDIRDCTLPIQPHVNSCMAPSLLNDLSYSVLFRMLQTQLQLGLSVVVDSPLSNKSRLDCLTNAVESARVVIVECRPKDEAEWRRRLEGRGVEDGESHKPGTWEELQMLVEGYGGCWDYDVGDVERIVVDTTDKGGEESRLSMVLDFIYSVW